MVEWAKGLILAALFGFAACCFLVGWLFYTPEEGPYWEVTGPAWTVGAVVLLVGAISLVRVLVQRGGHN